MGEGPLPTRPLSVEAAPCQGTHGCPASASLFWRPAFHVPCAVPSTWHSAGLVAQQLCHLDHWPRSNATQFAQRPDIPACLFRQITAPPGLGLASSPAAVCDPHHTPDTLNTQPLLHRASGSTAPPSCSRYTRCSKCSTVAPSTSSGSWTWATSQTCGEAGRAAYYNVCDSVLACIRGEGLVRKVGIVSSCGEGAWRKVTRTWKGKGADKRQGGSGWGIITMQQHWALRCRRPIPLNSTYLGPCGSER